MLYEAKQKDRIKYGSDGGQKEILPNFGLKFTPQTCEYKLNDEYSILFINTEDDTWKNFLSSDGLTLSETNKSFEPTWIDKDVRDKKRITFMRDTGHGYGGYAFIGVFELDKEYDYTKEVDPSGSPMKPKLKYNRISDRFDTDSI